MKKISHVGLLQVNLQQWDTNVHFWPIRTMISPVSFSCSTNLWQSSPSTPSSVHPRHMGSGHSSSISRRIVPGNQQQQRQHVLINEKIQKISKHWPLQSNLLYLYNFLSRLKAFHRKSCNMTSCIIKRKCSYAKLPSCFFPPLFSAMVLHQSEAAKSNSDHTIHS